MALHDKQRTAKMRHDSIGIDISKSKLDAHRLSDGAFAQFDNNEAGFQDLIRWIGTKAPARVVYEATGSFHHAFERACSDHLPLVKVNPLHARRFVQSFGNYAKTDRVDAHMLARMGKMHELQPDRPKPKEQYELKELQHARTALCKDRTRLLNRYKTQTIAMLRKLTRNRLAQVERQMAMRYHQMTQKVGCRGNLAFDLDARILGPVQMLPIGHVVGCAASSFVGPIHRV